MTSSSDGSAVQYLLAADAIEQHGGQGIWLFALSLFTLLRCLVTCRPCAAVLCIIIVLWLCSIISMLASVRRVIRDCGFISAVSTLLLLLLLLLLRLLL